MPNRQRADRRDQFLATATLTVKLLVVVGLVFLAVRPTNGIWEWQLKADLERQLPDGSTWDEADAWFAARGIPTSRICQHSSGSPQDKDVVGLYALVPNDSPIENAEIRIALFFDSNGRLYKRDVYRFSPSF